MDTHFLQSETWWFTWIVVPALILCARVADQTLGTLRVVFVSKGFKYLAPAVGFVESIIWLVAVSQILHHVSNPASYLAYGGGFAIGSFIGMTIEEKMSLGRVIVRVIPHRSADRLIEEIQARKFGLTYVDAQGLKGPVKMLFSVIERKEVAELVALINQWNPNAFYSIEEVKLVREGVFRPGAGHFAFLRMKLKKAK